MIHLTADIGSVNHQRPGSAPVFGGVQLPIAAISAATGGHVRVGLEDSLWIRPGVAAQSSAEQVRAVRAIMENLGHEIATPDEAREILALKGGDRVGF
jgi:uncharacterized protein (DUF849 family)